MNAPLRSSDDEQAPESPDPAETTVERAARLARAIRANPDVAEALLSADGLTLEAFETMMSVIASDPVQSAAFDAALQGPSPN